MHWQESSRIIAALETTFKRILASRMRGLPLLNPALTVQAVGFEGFNGDWLGILITPWFMNLLLLPGQDSAWAESQPGGKFEMPFPYGVFEFTLAGEADLGVYAQCSLFSPMFQFTCQDDALAAARAALQGLLAEPAPRSLSRRDLLRGSLGKGIS